MTDAARSRDTLSGLRALGIAVAIDDFGTGYSSLGQLLDLAPDALKVDRSFVADLGADVRSQPIVRTVVTLADDLGLTVTAEGIETAEQVARLRRLGVTRGQGFYFARPLAWEVVDDLLTGGACLPIGGSTGLASAAGPSSLAAAG